MQYLQDGHNFHLFTDEGETNGLVRCEFDVPDMDVEAARRAEAWFLALPWAVAPKPLPL